MAQLLMGPKPHNMATSVISSHLQRLLELHFLIMPQEELDRALYYEWTLLYGLIKQRYVVTSATGYYTYNMNQLIKLALTSLNFIIVYDLEALKTLETISWRGDSFRTISLEIPLDQFRSRSQRDILNARSEFFNWCQSVGANPSEFGVEPLVKLEP